MKLLVATDFPPDAKGGGPAVVRQMLENFPGEIHWWSGRKAESRGGFSVTSSKSFPPGKLMPSRKLTHLKACLMEHLWAPLAARDFRRTIERVQPDCIWVIPHDWSILPIHRVLGANSQVAKPKTQSPNGKSQTPNPKSEITNRQSPLANRKSPIPSWHTTIQDYPDAHGHPAAWGRGVCERLTGSQDDLYRSATSRDATSLPMLEDLESRTAAKGAQMLHQGLEAEDFAYLDKSEIPNPNSKILKIAYAGTILVPREFQLFVEALESIRSSESEIENRKSKISLELHLYGAHSYKAERWFRPDWMIEHGNLPERKLLDELRQCDWGFIPMSLEDHNPRYNRFSFPTKFITYLAAGLPVITMGHPESSVIKMAEQYRVGIRISDCRLPIADLATALADPQAKQKYRPEIIRCAREQFDAEKMRTRLWGAFRGEAMS